LESKIKKLPAIDPQMKLPPTINPIGKLADLLFSKLTLVLVELFWIPIIKIRNKEE
tara:strand:+ start:160 stop:327 length:168 start_codon:yes stop_codon:yes gene_type:complete